jgi:phospholipid/cholesterol/gamma-HCH transport system ATP-binding protein
MLINEIQKRYHTASLIITHDLSCAKVTSNRMIILHEGKNYVESTYDKLSVSEDPPVRAFFT